MTYVVDQWTISNTAVLDTQQDEMPQSAMNRTLLILLK